MSFTIKKLEHHAKASRILQQQKIEYEKELGSPFIGFIEIFFLVYVVFLLSPNIWIIKEKFKSEDIVSGVAMTL